MSTEERITIKLDNPIKQGGQEIDEFQLRKPMAGDLRGIKLLDVMQMDVNAYAPLLSRITAPLITEQNVYQLDPSDLITVMTEVQSFFVGREESPET